MQIQKPSDLARIVKTRRQAQHLTQQEIADAVGTTRQSIARIERGHGGASFDTVLRILEKLDIRLEATAKPRRQQAGSISGGDRIQKIIFDALDAGRNTSTLAAAAAEATREIDTSALAAAAAEATREIDTSALAAAAAAATREIDTSALAAAANRKVDISAFAAAAAAATREIDASALIAGWRTALNDLTHRVQETAARTGSDIGVEEARKALLSAAIEAGDPDREVLTTDRRRRANDNLDGPHSG
ncbi:DNA-binding transcriptional regulator, XRE-family HTH domain [Paramicrobacterium humi]|uniref:DNA-binding transcriptional regulator, XRE-family HTH domain n=1 Tax=Paramicrobacterium humi TaxID=640635 RepID=A0A1H4NUH4_9MICO|nr:helix-turn-helix transcriptional regulator [Microbacterium humi]SEB98860.1 DNA-binding transcriptional regulator, XRE-family HTH domain [Microbacterium humi]